MKKNVGGGGEAGASSLGQTQELFCNPHYTANGKTVVVRVPSESFLLLLSSYVEFLVLKKILPYSVRVRVYEFLHTGPVNINSKEIFLKWFPGLETW